MQQRKRVLITDDDPGIRDAFKIIFEHAGYDTDIYSGGTELFSNDYELPDLFILDRQLAGVDGLDICRHLKNEPRSKHLPVLILSATPNLDRLAISAGADAFQEKPFRMHDLLGKVRQLIEAL